MSSSKLLRLLAVLGFTLAACSSGEEPTSIDADGFAFPVVEGLAVDGPPVYRERGIARVGGSVPEVDQVALIARANGTALSDAVSVRAFVGEPRFVLSETVIDGRTIALSGDSTSFADVQIATIADPIEPGLLIEVRGVDPVEFLMNDGLDGISASITSDNEPQLDLAIPPEGYTIAIEATTRYRASPEVVVELEGADTRVQTTVNDPRFELIPQADFEQVTIGDRQAWRGQAGSLWLATWEEPEGVFTWAMSHEAERTDAVVRSTTMTDESEWRAFYEIDQPSDLLATLNGREFEAFTYEGYPFDPAAEDRSLTISFTDDTIIVRGVCSSRNARVTSRADTVEATGPIQVVGAGCELEGVDQWQNELTLSPLTLSLVDDTLTVRATVDGEDVVIGLAETTFSGYS